jgi:hypothetical protein
VKWVDLAQNRYKWQAVRNIVMKMRISKKKIAEKFLIN